jgi:hypothetical protein
MARHVTGLTIYVGEEGALYYRGPTRFAGTSVEGGDLIPIEYPEGATLGSHVLVTGDDDHPVWMAREDFATLLGTGAGAFAWMYMTTIDETGATVLMTDDDGTPILTYAPVT